jgi:hypothetical protein
MLWHMGKRQEENETEAYVSDLLGLLAEDDSCGWRIIPFMDCHVITTINYAKHRDDRPSNFRDWRGDDARDGGRVLFRVHGTKAEELLACYMRNALPGLLYAWEERYELRKELDEARRKIRALETGTRRDPEAPTAKETLMELYRRTHPGCGK